MWIGLLLRISKFRAVVKSFVDTNYFEYTSLVVILANSIILAMNDSSTSSADQVVATSDNYFLFYYCSELLLKIIAYGIYKKSDAYFRSIWNIFDFAIVVFSFVSIINPTDGQDTSFNLSSLRSFRVLRPLKSITKLGKLKQIIVTVTSFLPNLLEIGFILLLFLSIMAITGVQLYKGVLSTRCVNDLTKELGRSCGNIDCEPGYTCMEN